MPPLDRRRFLKLGVAATALSVGGCLGSTVDPSYTDWVPQSDDGVVIGYIDFSLADRSSAIDPVLPVFLPSEGESDETRYVPDLSDVGGVDDALVRIPFDVGGRVIGAGSIGLAAAGLGYLVDPERPALGVTELLVANGSVVGIGDLDVDRADESLRAGNPDLPLEVPFTPVGEEAAFTVYESNQSGEQGAVALSDSSVVVGDTRAAVRKLVRARHGDGDRATEASGTVDWLVDTAGSGDVVVGWHGDVDLSGYFWTPPEEQSVSEFATDQASLMSSLTLSPGDDEITADLAIEDPSMADARRDGLASRLGDTSTDTSLSFEGERLSATGTYTEAVVDVDFSERPAGTLTPTPGLTAIPTSADPPPEIADAADPSAFEFSYKEETDRVGVTITEAIDADELTIRAVRSGYEASTTTPQAELTLYTYVDGAGDVVVVSVTVDGVSGEVVRREFP